MANDHHEDKGNHENEDEDFSVDLITMKTTEDDTKPKSSMGFYPFGILEFWILAFRFLVFDGHMILLLN